MPKKPTEKTAKNKKPWWDESNLVEVTDEKGRTVKTLFPEVVEAKKVAVGTVSLPVARCILFFERHKDLAFFEMHPTGKRTENNQ